MHVVLYCDLPGEKRFSMDRYGRELAKALNAGSSGTTATMYVPPESTTFSGGPFPFSKVGNYYSRFLRYPWLAARQRADVHHIVDHGYGHLGFLLDPDRTVVTCHDLMLLKARSGDVPWKFRPRIATWMFRFSVRGMQRAAHIIANSEQTKRDIVSMLGYPADRITAIPLGVSDNLRRIDSPTKLLALRDRYGIREQGFAVLHVGTCDPYKNLEGALRAIAEARKSDAGVVLVKVGGLTPDLWRLARQLELERSIVVLGEVTDEELAGIYGMCNCLLFPSSTEGFGLPPIEAMACGLPIVVSRTGAIPEVVGDAGIYVEPHDVASMAAAVLSLRDDTRAEMFRQRGTERAQRFTWAEAARCTESIYQEVLARAVTKDAVPSLRRGARVLEA